PDDDVYVVDTRGRSRGGSGRSGSPAREPRSQNRPPLRPTSSRRKSPGRSAVYRRRRIVVGAGVLLVAWLAFMVWVPFQAWTNVHRVNASPSGARPGNSKGYDYVLVGSDSRQGMTAAQEKQLNTGSAEQAAGGGTDSILLVHVPTRAG